MPMLAETVKGTVVEVRGRRFTLDNGQTYATSRGVDTPSKGDTLEGKVREWTSPEGDVVKFFTPLGAKRSTKLKSSGTTILKEDPDRQKKIIRQNVLAHATALAIAQGQTTTKNVLNLAAELEVWVNR